MTVYHFPPGRYKGQKSRPKRARQEKIRITLDELDRVARNLTQPAHNDMFDVRMKSYATRAAEDFGFYEWAEANGKLPPAGTDVDGYAMKEYRRHIRALRAAAMAERSSGSGQEARS